MKRIVPDRRTAMAARRAKATIIAEYRGFASVKPAWSDYTYKVAETITLAKHATTINADEAGVRAFTEMSSALAHVPASVVAFCAHRTHCSVAIPKIHKIAAKPVALCNGQRGWMNAYSSGSSGDVYEQVYARAGGTMYMAGLRYPHGTVDVLHAEASLATLCPPGIGEVPAPTTVVPLSVPKGWSRGVGDVDPRDDSSYKVLAYWLYLPRNSTYAHYLTLGDASDVSEYVTPEQDAVDQIDAAKAAEKGLRVQASHAVKLCGRADGWFSEFTATDAGGDRYTAETMYAYGNDTSYVLRYVRAATQPEDPQARKALFSLCPPQSRTP